MSIAKKIIHYLSDEDYRFLNNSAHGRLNSMPDEEYLKYMYKIKMGRELDLENPQTFNEKLQWLKLYDRKPIYTTMVDKYASKEYVASIIGEEYIIPTLGVWDRFEDIDFDKLPEQFVLKCTHDSGGLVIVKDKNVFDKTAAKIKINKSLKRNYYYSGREWPYKNVPRKIIAEQYMVNDDSVPEYNQELTDYKFYCFNGHVDCCMICYDRASNDTKFYFFDREWNLKRINKRGKEAPADFSLPKPECYDEMITIAEKLSQDIAFLRVDLYQSNHRVYFGEMTFYPSSGFDSNYLPETDRYFGDLIDLSLAYDTKNRCL